MAPNPTPIFHITPVENLRMILEAGELRAKRALDQEDSGYTNQAWLVLLRRPYDRTDTR